MTLDKCLLTHCPRIRQDQNRRPCDCPFYSTSAGEYLCSLNATESAVLMTRLEHPDYIARKGSNEDNQS